MNQAIDILMHAHVKLNEWGMDQERTCGLRDLDARQVDETLQLRVVLCFYQAAQDAIEAAIRLCMP